MNPAINLPFTSWLSDGALLDKSMLCWPHIQRWYSMSTQTLETMAGEQLDGQLAQLEERLTHDHPALAPGAIHELVERERTRFADAHVRAFVPILVERAVRTSLDR